MTELPAIDRFLEDARAWLERVTVMELPHEQQAGALVVDMRPIEQRQRDGELPGALVIDRNVLEWRLDPSCPHRTAFPRRPTPTAGSSWCATRAIAPA
jgi:hypothetical protein